MGDALREPVFDASGATGAPGAEARPAPASTAKPYDAARNVLAAAKTEALSAFAAEARKRRIAVAVAAVVWLIVSVVLVMAVGSDLLLVGEIGFVAIVAWGVFYLWPTFVGAGNLEELFAQHATRLDQLERVGVDFPPCADMGDLEAALDYVSLPEDDSAH
ncbi:MAG TPA: hypothetical protein DCP91_13555 [Eggerthellaceae bacterium]|nr:hypothetical protein [Eggerthellaceae bacterium]